MRGTAASTNPPGRGLLRATTATKATFGARASVLALPKRQPVHREPANPNDFAKSLRGGGGPSNGFSSFTRRPAAMPAPGNAMRRSSTTGPAPHERSLARPAAGGVHRTKAAAGRHTTPGPAAYSSYSFPSQQQQQQQQKAAAAAAAPVGRRVPPLLSQAALSAQHQAPGAGEPRSPTRREFARRRSSTATHASAVSSASALGYATPVRSSSIVRGSVGGCGRKLSNSSLRSASSSQLASSYATVHTAHSSTPAPAVASPTTPAAIITKAQFESLYHSDMALVQTITQQVRKVENSAKAMDAAAERVIEHQSRSDAVWASKTRRRSTGAEVTRKAMRNARKVSDPDFDFGSVHGVLKRSHRVEAISQRRAQLAMDLMAPSDPRFDLDSAEVVRRLDAHASHVNEMQARYPHLVNKQREEVVGVELDAPVDAPVAVN